MNSLKVYNDCLFDKGYVEAVYIKLKKDKVMVANGSEDEVSVLTEQQVQQFLFHLEKESERNRLMGYLLLYTGVRVSELVGIKRADIDPVEAVLTVTGKGKLPRSAAQTGRARTAVKLPKRRACQQQTQRQPPSFAQPESTKNAPRQRSEMARSRWQTARLPRAPAHATTHILYSPSSKRSRADDRVKARWTCERKYDRQILHSDVKG